MFRFAIGLLLFFASSAFGSSYRDSIDVKNGTISITEQARQDIAVTSLAEIMFQACSEPYLENGEQVGYRLFEIDTGSVYETVGLKNNDIVLEIEGITLADPHVAIQMLRYAKTQDSFTYLVQHDGKRKRYQVQISGT